MEFVDTHCHTQSSNGDTKGEANTRSLWQKAGDPSGEDILARARAADVTKMICVGCSLEDSQLAVEFVQQHDTTWASIGIHPHEAQHYMLGDEQLATFVELATRPKVVAVGECGLDYYYEHSPKEAQIPILRFQLELAQKHNLPLIFHVRDAFADFWPIFDEYKNVRGVLHSFTDNQSNLEAGLQRGLYIGVNGIATFAKKPDQLAVYKSIPLANLLLETDAPFLTPTPFRGTICEPKHVRVTAEFLANLRGEDLDKLATVTTSNARKLFGI